MNIDFAASALLMIDVQYDFCPGGALAVPRGDEVIPPLNELAGLFARHHAPVIATQDWHPAGHCSFRTASDGLHNEGWPVHCVQGSRGAALHKALDSKAITLILRKGFRPAVDSYSAFFENDRVTATGLAGFLRTLERKTVYIGGLALDYCVLFSALDAAALGFRTLIVEDAVRAVSQDTASLNSVRAALRQAGVLFTEL